MLQSRLPRARPAYGPRIATKAPRLVVCVRASAEYDAMRGKTVYKASSGEPFELTSLWEASPGCVAVLPCLTHFADLASWEFAQQLLKVLPTLEDSGVRVITLGLGSVGNAQAFSRALHFPSDRLFSVPSAELYRQLGFSPGFGAELELPPALKLLPMLAGVGSPGTLQEVIRGYTGDEAARPVFDSPSPFDVLGRGYQRPMELASRRLLNMAAIVPQWSELAPPDPRLLTQQGGTLVLSGPRLLLKHVDSGILRQCGTDAILQAALRAEFRDSGSSGGGEGAAGQEVWVVGGPQQPGRE